MDILKYGIRQGAALIYGAVYERSSRYFQLTFCNPNEYAEDIPSDLKEIYTTTDMTIIEVDLSGRQPAVGRGASANLRGYKTYGSDFAYAFVYITFGWPRMTIVYKN